MVRIPSFSRHQETAPTRAGSQVASDDRSSTDTASTGPSSSTATVTRTDETRDSRRVGGRVAVAERPPKTDRVPELEPSTERVVPAGPRPRASMLATLGLIVGVAAALFVLTGTLAGYGIGLGVLALLFSIGGVSATGRRHVAGKTDALIGLLLGLGAVLLGVLAVSGEFNWPTMDGDTVQRFREWLDSQFVNRF